MSYDVYSKFDLEQHKKTYINYFEAIINRDGSVEYAVPSHSEIVIRKYMEKYNVDRQYIYTHFMGAEDIAKKLGIIMCWSEQVDMCEKPTMAQLKTLALLRKEGLIING